MTRQEAQRLALWAALTAGLIFVFGSLWERIGFEPFVVEGPSMQPTLGPGDRFFLERGAYRAGRREWATPERGDIVVAENPVDGSIVVKRALAVGGDTILGRDGIIVINGQAVTLGHERPCRFDSRRECRVRSEAFGGEAHDVAWAELDDFGPIHVPAGSVFLLGDHRDHSNDSRNPLMGPVRTDLILGRVGWSY